MRPLEQLSSLSFALAALLVFAAGCGRDDVKVYKVDSSDTTTAAPPSAAMSPSGMPGTMPPGLAVPDKSGLPGLKYNLPAGWKEKELTQMRAASFDISEDGKSVDVSVVPLGPMSGTDAANVTRWLGQVGQPPVDDDGAKKIAEAVQVGDKPANLYDLNGGDQRIIGAILHTDDATWYFKMMGDSALSEKNKPAFIAFLKSVEFQKPTASAPVDLTQLPPSHPALPDTSAQTAAAPADKPVWMVPSDWKEDNEPSQFVLVRYVIQSNGNPAAEATVSELDGNGGGLLPNVNRWRGQLSLPPISEGEAAKLPTIDASGAKAIVVDLTGTYTQGKPPSEPARTIAVVLPLNGQTWFYKLMGNPDVVAAQKDAFIAFVQSAKYPAK